MRHRTVGYLLHPKIKLSSHARVADIATGTGVIVTELAKSLPETCRFDGFDISDAQFPAKLPNNVKLHVANVKEPLPTECHGQFDLVFIRYLNAAMTPEDWKVVARNLCQLLKPGGWIQWIEGDFAQAINWTRLDPNHKSNGAAQEASEITKPHHARLRYFTDELANILRDVGFQNVAQDVTSSDRIPETRPLWTDMTIGPLMGLLGRMTSPEHCNKLRADILEEAKAGVIYSRYDIHTFLGQKK